MGISNGDFEEDFASGILYVDFYGDYVREF